MRVFGYSRRAALGVGAALALIACGLLLLNGVARGGGSLGSKEDQRAAVSSKAPGLPDLVRAFRRDQVEADRIPGDPIADLDATGTRVAGEDPRLSRRLRLGHRAVYVWPANDRACYAFRNAGGCVPMDMLKSEGVVVNTIFTSANPTVELFAFVAPGVRDVRVRLADGTEREASIADDAFAMTVTADPISVAWLNPDGSQGRRTGLVVRPTD